MIRTKGFPLPLLLFFTLAFTACDPAHHGKAFIRNSSSYSLELKFDSISDIITIIEPDSYVQIFDFAGRGAGMNFSCCPCERANIILQPVDTTKHLVKEISDNQNWQLTNHNKRRLNGKEIKCVFEITPLDIQ